MEWSPQQEQALKEIENWFHNSDKQVFRLFGYAGTGKTTLAKHIAEQVHGEVLFGAYTGKAAHVLKQKGCKGAMTIHSMLYLPVQKPDNKLEELKSRLFELKINLKEQNMSQELIEKHVEVTKLEEQIREENGNLQKPSFSDAEASPIEMAQLVIIDECSMVDEKMGEDLLKWGTKVLVLGDPAQLPPVKGGGFFTENVKPDMMLTEIHRQAQDNPIIKLATDVREGRPLVPGQYGTSRVINRHQMTLQDAMQHDQLLCWRNATRRTYNQRIREASGYTGPYPNAGEKLVCQHNNHNLDILNGALFFTDDSAINDPSEEHVLLKIHPENDPGKVFAVDAHKRIFEGRKLDIPWDRVRDAEQFDYGYVLTVHKAQGSQWNKVLLMHEYSMNNDTKRRWLYTGITRAAEAVTVVIM